MSEQRTIELVQRLRGWGGKNGRTDVGYIGGRVPTSAMHEAADEIERLTRELARWESPDNWGAFVELLGVPVGHPNKPLAVAASVALMKGERDRLLAAVQQGADLLQAALGAGWSVKPRPAVEPTAPGQDTGRIKEQYASFPLQSPSEIPKNSQVPTLIKTGDSL